ncbi:hypothetical protein [Roseibium alexandrii]|uniref:hypothetical protein n=1 Tax=Roseibium alexandrii TaxID=388408 RepID=UPI003752DFBD
MLEYLIDRENEEMLRAERRTLTFPDGETRTIQAYRLVWRWFDHLIAAEYGPSEETILQHTLQWAQEKSVPLEQALSELVDYTLKCTEDAGMDVTDDPYPLMLAREGLAKFTARKEKR